MDDFAAVVDVFTCVVEARGLIGSWRDDYDELRPNRALGGQSSMQAWVQGIAF